VGRQLGRFGPQTGWQVLLVGRTHLSGTAVSLVGGDPGVPMSNSRRRRSRSTALTTPTVFHSRDATHLLWPRCSAPSESTRC
jgi:hypothetical protein